MSSRPMFSLKKFKILCNGHPQPKEMRVEPVVIISTLRKEIRRFKCNICGNTITVEEKE